MNYDVIICGLGAMGSAAAYHLAKSGVKVLGLDQFRPPHDKGSSHGKTRIIREAYFEHPDYVPLVQRAYKLWNQVEKESGENLFLKTGGLMIGAEDGILVSGAIRSAQEHRLAHQLLRAEELRKQFPTLAVNDTEVAVREPRAGILFPELAIQTHLQLAKNFGADFRYEESVVRWEPHRGGVRVVTTKSSYTAGRLLLAAGSWLSSLVPELRLPLTVERQVLFWFEPVESARARFCSDDFPVFIWEHAPRRYFYGFPNLGDGVKMAMHHEGEITTADTLNRQVSPEEITQMKHLLQQYIPAVAGKLLSASVCMYTNTPDEHFILDRHPIHSQVVIASPCSGHGFKFSPAVGEIAALLIRDARATVDLSLFRLDRFART